MKKLLTTILLLLPFFADGSYDTITQSAEIYFEFEEASGTTVTNSGTGANGTFVGSPTFSQTGEVGDAILFNPTNDYVTITGFTATAIDTFTVAVRIKTTSSGEYINLFGANNSGTSERLQFVLTNTGAIQMFFRGVNSATLQQNTLHTPSVNIYDGNWHRLVWVVDPTGMDLYIDGVAESLTLTMNNTGGSLTPPYEPGVNSYNTDDSWAVGAGSRTLDEFVFDAGTAWDATDVGHYEAGPVALPAGTVTITGPSPGDVDRDGLELTWSYDDSDHTGFTVQIAEENTFSSPKWDESVATDASPYDISTKLLDSDTYYIRVAASNAGGNGSWSSSIAINTDSSPLTMTFPTTRGTPVLTASSLAADDFFFFNAYLTSDWDAYITGISTKYFALYSQDHETPSTIRFGTFDNMDLSDFSEQGIVLEDSDISGWHSTETPYLILNEDDPNGRDVYLYYHAQEDVSPQHQMTRLVSSAGGTAFDAFTWTDEGTMFDTDGEIIDSKQVVHTGYANIVKLGPSSWIAWSRYSALGEFQQGRWTSTNGITWGSPDFKYINESSPDDLGDWALPNSDGMFKYGGNWWKLQRASNEAGDYFLAIHKRDSVGYPDGQLNRLFTTPLGVGQETDPSVIQIDGSLRATNGRYQIENDGILHVYYTRNDPNNDNDSLFYGTIDVRQLTETTSGTTTNFDTTGLANGDYTIILKTDDSYDSVGVTVNN